MKCNDKHPSLFLDTKSFIHMVVSRISLQIPYKPGFLDPRIGRRHEPCGMVLMFDVRFS